MKTFLRKVSLLSVTAVMVFGAVSSIAPNRATALSGNDFRAGRIIDDSVFFDGNRMSEQDIANFLQSKVPSCDNWGTQPYGGTTRRAYSESRGVSVPFTCLKDYQENVGGRAADQFCAGAIGGGQKSAPRIIKEVSVACSVSPMILLVLLQKEQGLVTDDWPWPVQYQKATGYGCPDTAACDPEFSGFFNQVYYAGRQYKRYAIQPDLFSYKANRNNFIQYNPNAGCSGTQVNVQGQATAGLYNYTPYQPNAAALNNLYGTGDGCSAYGNRNFWRLYNDWFGPSLTDRCSYETGKPITTGVTFRKLQRNLDAGNFIIYSGTSTDCIESHTWNPGFGSWQQNIATIQQTVNAADAEVQYADLDGDGRDEGVLVGYRNTGSGMVEFHVWDTTLRKWVVHAASNLPAVDPAKFMIRFADFNGDGKDEPVAIGYADTGTGKVEFHFWGAGVNEWAKHWVTNLPAINLANMTIAFGDLDGDRRDEAVAIGLNGTASNMIEFHVWNAGLWDWQRHYASNHPAITATDGDVQFADLDGDGIDVGVVIGKRNTGSGRIEFHVWNPYSFDSWQGHYASNQSVL